MAHCDRPGDRHMPLVKTTSLTRAICPITQCIVPSAGHRLRWHGGRPGRGLHAGLSGHHRSAADLTFRFDPNYISQKQMAKHMALKKTHFYRLWITPHTCISLPVAKRGIQQPRPKKTPRKIHLGSWGDTRSKPPREENAGNRTFRTWPAHPVYSPAVPPGARLKK